MHIVKNNEDTNDSLLAQISALLPSRDTYFDKVTARAEEALAEMLRVPASARVKYFLNGDEDGGRYYLVPTKAGIEILHEWSKPPCVVDMGDGTPTLYTERLAVTVTLARTPMRIRRVIAKAAPSYIKACLRGVKSDIESSEKVLNSGPASDLED